MKTVPRMKAYVGDPVCFCASNRVSPCRGLPFYNQETPSALLITHKPLVGSSNLPLATCQHKWAEPCTGNTVNGKALVHAKHLRTGDSLSRLRAGALRA